MARPPHPRWHRERQQFAARAEGKAVKPAAALNHRKMTQSVARFLIPNVNLTVRHVRWVREQIRRPGRVGRLPEPPKAQRHAPAVRI